MVTQKNENSSMKCEVCSKSIETDTVFTKAEMKDAGKELITSVFKPSPSKHLFKVSIDFVNYSKDFKSICNLVWVVKWRMYGRLII